jgi:hypothetical protein
MAKLMKENHNTENEQDRRTAPATDHPADKFHQFARSGPGF